MPSKNGIGAAAWVAAMGAAVLATVVQADVTIQQQIVVDGFGPMKFGAMDGESSTSISGNSARTEQQSRFRSRLLRAFAKGGGAHTVRIIRLDAETIDEIDVTRRQYTEQTFQQVRDRAAQVLGGIQNAADNKESPSGAPVDESKCQWSPAKSELRQTGEQASIAGADATRSIITVTTTCADPNSGTRCDFVFLLDEWLAADLPGSEETRAFWRSYAQKLNLSGALQDNLQSASPAIFSRYQSGWGEALKQAGALKGVPVKTVYSMQYGGPQCHGNGAGGGQADSGAGVAPADQASGSRLPTSPGAALNDLASGIFSKLHKKSDVNSKSEEAAPAPGMISIYQMSTQTTTVSTGPVPGSAFEVPAGYTKVETAAVPTASRASSPQG